MLVCKFSYAFSYIEGHTDYTTFPAGINLRGSVFHEGHKLQIYCFSVHESGTKMKFLSYILLSKFFSTWNCEIFINKKQLGFLLELFSGFEL